MSKSRIEAIYPLSPFQEMLLSRIVEAPRGDWARGLLNCNVDGHLGIAAFEKSWNQIKESE